MPTISHLIIGALIPVLIYVALNKKISIETVLYFIAGSILPDLYTFVKIFVFSDVCKYISWNAPHGVIAWIIWGFVFAIIFHFSFQRFSKLKLKQIFIILLSAGWLHLGLDMLTEPVRIIGDCYLSISSFYTSVMILKEQDFIIVFYVIFIIIPIMLLLIEIRKEERMTPKN
ncbi:MAG TPA: metal-dependent hydrolase [Candidatus Paceibacterota bacterium]|nr:metal-dependent hydrolase [Candidatus Paceibacterota bacterium]